MRRDQRLRKSRDFAAVRREGRSWPSHYLVLGARPNGLETTRFGFSVGKRVGNAVVRNRVKRRLREAARLSIVQDGWDLVFIARKDCSSASYQQLADSMSGLLKRARVLESTTKVAGS